LTSNKVQESTGARELECVNFATRVAASARVLALRVTGIVPPVVCVVGTRTREAGRVCGVK
jgi:hypothetical protein